MATFINRLCPNQQCESHKQKTMTGDLYRALCEVVGGDSTSITLKCETCGTSFADRKPEKRKTMSYSKGYYCASTDQTFNSYSEQRAYEKKHKLEPM